MSHVDCPTCGHNTSAYAGSCTAFVVATAEELAAGAPKAYYCGHDCSVDLFGESLHDIIVRQIQEGRKDGPV